MVFKGLPSYRSTVREVWEISVGLNTGGDDGDEAGGEDGGNADEGDIGDFLECTGNSQASIVVSTSIIGDEEGMQAHRKDMMAMMAAHAMLQIAPLEMLSRAMAPERACDPATKTDWNESERTMKMELFS